MMDISTIAGAASMMQSSQTQQVLSAAMIKMNADAQSRIAELLLQNAQQMPQPSQSQGSGFSTYA